MYRLNLVFVKAINIPRSISLVCCQVVSSKKRKVAQSRPLRRNPTLNVFRGRCFSAGDVDIREKKKSHYSPRNPSTFLSTAGSSAATSPPIYLLVLLNNPENAPSTLYSQSVYFWRLESGYNKRGKQMLMLGISWNGVGTPGSVEQQPFHFRYTINFSLSGVVILGPSRVA